MSLVELLDVERVVAGVHVDRVAVEADDVVDPSGFADAEGGQTDDEGVLEAGPVTPRAWR